MLDIKFIRENPDLVKNGARKKKVQVDIDRLLAVDKQRRELLQEVDELRARRNVLAKEKPTPETVKEGKELKEKLKGQEKELDRVEKEFGVLMLDVPQVPAEEVPEGDSDADNKPLRHWGEKPEFDFPIKDHMALAKSLDLIDFERGAKVSGFRGYFLKNEAVLIVFGLWDYALRHLLKKGFVPLEAPALVKEPSLIGTGWLPQGKDEVYSTQDGLYLAGTSEVPVMGYHQGEVLAEKELPKTYAAFSSCFRSEVGSYGKDTKGIYRLHEFMKIEQVVFCRADEKESVKWHEEITKNAEEIVQALGLHYRIVVNCAGDLGLGQVKKYDIETWIPSQEKYGETHSSSYFFDFQTRRLNIRYRTKGGEVKFAHSLNNTALATPRILIQILENNQQKDGSVKVPDILQSYVGKKVIKPRT